MTISYMRDLFDCEVELSDHRLGISVSVASVAMGKISYGSTEAEKKFMAFRRSLYIIQDLKAGDLLTRENLKPIRPGHGLQPKYYDIMLGKKVSKNVKKGTPVNWDLLA